MYAFARLYFDRFPALTAAVLCAYLPYHLIDIWSPGVPFASRHLLPVPGDAPPGEYRLLISIHAFGDAAWLPARDAHGTPLDDYLLLPVMVYMVAP